MSYADSLRQQARWIREALDPATPESQRIDLGDVDVEEFDGAATEIERLQAAKRGALSIADERAKEAVGLRAENERLRAALSSLVTEFKDYHYHNCPADKNDGGCTCFAGAILKKAEEVMFGHQQRMDTK